MLMIIECQNCQIIPSLSCNPKEYYATQVTSVKDLGQSTSPPPAPFNLIELFSDSHSLFQTKFYLQHLSSARSKQLQCLPPGVLKTYGNGNSYSSSNPLIRHPYQVAKPFELNRLIIAQRGSVDSDQSLDYATSRKCEFIKNINNIHRFIVLSSHGWDFQQSRSTS